MATAMFSNWRGLDAVKIIIISDGANHNKKNLKILINIPMLRQANAPISTSFMIYVY